MEIKYAIIDGAVESELLNFLQETNPPHYCLYSEPIQPDLVALAPYLAQVTPEVEAWLRAKDTPWGIFLTTQSSMNVLRQHLRKYLQVLIPGETKPVLFRFYDPRNIWDFLSVLSEWEKYLFLGPLDTITTHWKNEQQHRNFSALKDNFSADGAVRQKMMRISRSQMASLTQIFEQLYLTDLTEKIKSWSGQPEDVTQKIVGATFQWLRDQGITDDRSIRGLFYLFCQRGCLAVDAISTDFREILCDINEEGVFKAETLLIKELGDVPL
ncbi:DUF4123 domain-containing protein [Salmonella enterica]|nr:DUF4123 domain-containing protein [Salmonella enterica]EJJ4249163.1 DUF4123 domain-containing protein [Salmonella enterica]